MHIPNRPVRKPGPYAEPRPSSRLRRAMTLVEIMITMGVFTMMVLAMITSHLLGLRTDQFVESKLGASETARRGFDKMANEIRAAKNWQVGNMSGMNFVDIPDGQTQAGSTLQISLKTNAYPMVPPYILYYFTNISGDNQLCRFHTGDAAPTVLASNLIDTLTFSAENYSNSVMTSLTYRYVIHYTLKFREYQFPLTKVGTNYLYDLYKIEFRLTPHAPS
jgi:hypothetical protein